jgi:hypothetical protein
MENEKTVSEQIVVVKELPTQQVREALSEDGKTKFTLVTEDEAISEILTRIRRMDKAL